MAPGPEPTAAGRPLPTFGRADGLALALLGVALAWPAAAWVEQWLAIPSGDMAHHLATALALQEQLGSGLGLPDALTLPWRWTDPGAYPPLGYAWPSALGALAGGFGLVGLCASQVAWLWVLALGTWLLGLRLWNRSTALAAALLVATAPRLVTYTRFFLLDLAAAATATLALAALAWSDGFRSRGWSLLAGLLVGAAALTKWTALFFLAPALLWAGGMAARGQPRRHLAGFLGLVLALGLFTAWALHRWGAVAALEPGRLLLEGDAVGTFLRAEAGAVALLGGVGFALLPPGPLRHALAALLLAHGVAGAFYVLNHLQLVWRGQMELGLAFGHPLEDLDTLARFLSLLAPAFPDPRVPPALAAADVALRTCFAAGVVWVLARPLGGRRVGWVLLPLLGGGAALLAVNLPMGRYWLPAVPLVVLLSVGWLLASRPMRLVALPLFLGLGLFRLGLWTAGDLVPDPVELPPPPGGERLVSAEGTASGTLNDWLDGTIRRLGRAAGGRPALVLYLPPDDLLQAPSFQVFALLRGEPLFLTEVVAPPPGDGSAARADPGAAGLPGAPGRVRGDPAPGPPAAPRGPPPEPPAHRGPRLPPRSPPLPPPGGPHPPARPPGLRGHAVPLPGSRGAHGVVIYSVSCQAHHPRRRRRGTAGSASPWPRAQRSCSSSSPWCPSGSSARSRGSGSSSPRRRRATPRLPPRPLPRERARI